MFINLIFYQMKTCSSHPPPSNKTIFLYSPAAGGGGGGGGGSARSEKFDFFHFFSPGSGAPKGEVSPLTPFHFS